MKQRILFKSKLEGSYNQTVYNEGFLGLRWVFKICVVGKPSIDFHAKQFSWAEKHIAIIDHPKQVPRSAQKLRCIQLDRVDTLVLIWSQNFTSCSRITFHKSHRCLMEREQLRECKICSFCATQTTKRYPSGFLEAHRLTGNNNRSEPLPNPVLRFHFSFCVFRLASRVRKEVGRSIAWRQVRCALSESIWAQLQVAVTRGDFSRTRRTLRGEKRREGLWWQLVTTPEGLQSVAER